MELIFSNIIYWIIHPFHRDLKCHHYHILNIYTYSSLFLGLQLCPIDLSVYSRAERRGVSGVEQAGLDNWLDMGGVEVTSRFETETWMDVTPLIKEIEARKGSWYPKSLLTSIHHSHFRQNKIFNTYLFNLLEK